MAARFASEKGVEVLLNAMPHILEQFPDAQVWFAGPYENIMGEEAYFQRLAATIQTLQRQGAWKFMGSLDPAQMAAFYPNIDVLVIPSLNSTEAFGLVQIEAMINGAPSIAADLPGVRQPVKRHGMGKVVPIGDSQALAQAVVEIMHHKKAFQGDIEAIRKMYAPDSIAQEYEILFNEIKSEIG
jgi:glycosyltransferase involved in cell wall biosynthesis